MTQKEQDKKNGRPSKYKDPDKITIHCEAEEKQKAIAVVKAATGRSLADEFKFHVKNTYGIDMK